MVYTMVSYSLGIIALSALLLGLAKPRWVLPWFHRPTVKMVLMQYGALAVICGLTTALFWPGARNSKSPLPWPKASKTLAQIVLATAEVDEQSFLDLPVGWRGLTLVIRRDDLVKMEENDAAELMKAAVASYADWDRFRTVRVRLAIRESEGRVFAEAWQRQGQAVEVDTRPFGPNKQEVLKPTLHKDPVK